MFEAYFLEEYGRDSVVRECGFCLYLLNKEHGELFITDFYVKPEYRKTYEGKKLFGDVKAIAKKEGCDVVTALVSFGVKGPERSTRILKTYLAMGFKVIDAKNNQVILSMGVSDGRD